MVITGPWARGWHGEAQMMRSGLPARLRRGGSYFVISGTIRQPVSRGGKTPGGTVGVAAGVSAGVADGSAAPKLTQAQEARFVRHERPERVPRLRSADSFRPRAGIASAAENHGSPSIVTTRTGRVVSARLRG